MPGAGVHRQGPGQQSNSEVNIVNHRLHVWPQCYDAGLHRCLDECLLTGAEMELGPRAWQRDWYDSVDKIRLPTKLYVDDRDDNVIKVCPPPSPSVDTAPREFFQCQEENLCLTPKLVLTLSDRIVGRKEGDFFNFLCISFIYFDTSSLVQYSG